MTTSQVRILNISASLKAVVKSIKLLPLHVQAPAKMEMKELLNKITSLVQSESYQEDSQYQEPLAIQKPNMNLEVVIQRLWSVNPMSHNSR